MIHDVSFGIGCFFFNIGKRAPFLFDPKQHVEDIRKALESITNISDVAIEHDDIMYEVTPWQIENDVLPIDETRGVFCPALIDRIQFNLYIPTRVQVEILRKIGISDPLSTENFCVDYLEAYNLPVTFVECIGCTDHDRSSKGVIVVREFLKQAFAGFSGTRIRFEVLGPSPFHADCYLDADPEGNIYSNDWDYRCNREASTGYDHLSFVYSPALIDEEPLEEIKQRLFFSLKEELGLYYAIVQSSGSLVLLIAVPSCCPLPMQGQFGACS